MLVNLSCISEVLILKSPSRIGGWFLWFWSHVKTSENAYRTCNECFFVGEYRHLPTEHLEWFHRLYVVKETRHV